MRKKEILRRLLLSRGVEITRVTVGHNGKAAYSDVDQPLHDLLGKIPHTKVCVDVAAADGKQGCNTYALYSAGWTGFSAEADGQMFGRLALNYTDMPNVQLFKGFVTPLNVASLLQSAGIERSFGFLSLDIDSYDFDVLAALLSHYEPALMCVEFNEKFPPPVRFAARFTGADSFGGVFYGMSLSAANDLASAHGYVLVAVHYQNAFFARPSEANPVVGVEDAYKVGYVDKPDRRTKFYWNEPVEVVHSMSPGDVVEFFENHSELVGRRGAYTLGLDPIN